MESLRTAIVGCGQIADAHLQASQQSGLATVVAVCDRCPDLAQQAAVRFGVPEWHADVARMLHRTRPDVVHICTPPSTHRGLLQQAVEAGAHVYVEKPFALSAAEAHDMLAMAGARGRLVCAGHDRLFDPAWLECQRRIQAGAIGAIVHVEFFQAYDLDGPFGRMIAKDESHWVWQLRGGLFQNVIPHGLAVVADLLPDERPLVTAASWRRVLPEFDTELQVLVRGGQASATMTFVTGTRPGGSYVRMYGTRGWLEVDYEARGTRLRAAAPLPSLVIKIHAPWRSMQESACMLVRNVGRLLRGDLAYFSGMQRLVRLFYEAVSGHGESPTGPADVHRVSALMDDVVRALEGARELAR